MVADLFLKGENPVNAERAWREADPGIFARGKKIWESSKEAKKRQ